MSHSRTTLASLLPARPGTGTKTAAQTPAPSADPAEVLLRQCEEEQKTAAAQGSTTKEAALETLRKVAASHYEMQADQYDRVLEYEGMKICDGFVKRYAEWSQKIPGMVADLGAKTAGDNTVSPELVKTAEDVGYRRGLQIMERLTEKVKVASVARSIDEHYNHFVTEFSIGASGAASAAA